MLERQQQVERIKGVLAMLKRYESLFRLPTRIRCAWQMQALCTLKNKCAICRLKIPKPAQLLQDSPCLCRHTPASPPFGHSVIASLALATYLGPHSCAHTIAAGRPQHVATLSR